MRCKPGVCGDASQRSVLVTARRTARRCSAAWRPGSRRQLGTSVQSDHLKRLRVRGRREGLVDQRDVCVGQAHVQRAGVVLHVRNGRSLGNRHHIAPADVPGQCHLRYRGVVALRDLRQGRVAQECILDCRGFQAEAGIAVEDIAKRLQDFGFHAPTMSWPVTGTLMVEPTESEPKAELDRFVEAMVAIRAEITEVAEGRLDRADNPLKNAPHTAEEVTAAEWTHGYSRQQAAYPAPWVAAHKYWPPVKRVDNVYGDRNLACTCAPLEAYAQDMRIAAE